MGRGFDGPCSCEGCPPFTPQRYVLRYFAINHCQSAFTQTQWGGQNWTSSFALKIKLETSIKVVCLAFFTTWRPPEWREEGLLASAAVKGCLTPPFTSQICAKISLVKLLLKVKPNITKLRLYKTLMWQQTFKSMLESFVWQVSIVTFSVFFCKNSQWKLAFWSVLC